MTEDFTRQDNNVVLHLMAQESGKAGAQKELHVPAAAMPAMRKEYQDLEDELRASCSVSLGVADGATHLTWHPQHGLKLVTMAHGRPWMACPDGVLTRFLPLVRQMRVQMKVKVGKHSAKLLELATGAELAKSGPEAVSVGTAVDGPKVEEAPEEPQASALQGASLETQRGFAEAKARKTSRKP